MTMSLYLEHKDLILDGTKVAWHQERVDAWLRGERFAPITVDMALTRSCNFSCRYCYAMLQENARKTINRFVIDRFLSDCAEIGVKGISLVSDGESTISPQFVYSIVRGSELGISMAVGTNGYALSKTDIAEILPHLTYIRVNFSAGDRDRYSEIMGVKPEWYDQVIENLKYMVQYKKENNLEVTIGMQMVLKPEYGDQIIPLAKLASQIGPDYLVIKHCSDDEEGNLGVRYEDYAMLYETLEQAEAFSTENFQVKAKWSKIKSQGKRTYSRCYGPPFILQISGSGLIAPCGMLFNEKYKKFHIGNICEQSFKDIIKSDRYWDVMNHLASPAFDAKNMCGSLCLQHKVNEYLDQIQKQNLVPEMPTGLPPQHIDFI